MIARGLSTSDTDFPVVAIGGSAGGPEACTLLLDALPTATGMAFILVQHLDPAHESLLVTLLDEHTPLTVVRAADGTPLAPEHLYVIPPGSYPTVSDGALHMSPPAPTLGMRLPFDTLLRSLALEHGARAACIVLSGTGADGIGGLQAFKEAGGVILVQDPAEAGYDGMPRSAIATGLVDTVASAATLPAVLTAALTVHSSVPGASVSPPSEDVPTPSGPDVAGTASLSDMVALPNAQMTQDFTPFERGTLERRVERRMATAGASRLCQAEASSRAAVLAGLCRQAVLDAYAPAAVLCTMQHECLHLLGPTERYLRVPPGPATPDLTAMVRGAVRTRLRSALGRAAKDGGRVVVPGGRIVRDGRKVPFTIDVQPLKSDGEALLLVCFVDAPLAHSSTVASSLDGPRVAELEHELEAVRADLAAARRDLEAFRQEQRAINDVTRGKQEAAALGEAKQTEAANLANSRFLAAASHDLRQPLQTLVLLQGLLARTVVEGEAAILVARLDDTLGTMSDRLNTLLDLSRIETGFVQVEAVQCRISVLLDRLQEEFALCADAAGVALRIEVWETGTGMEAAEMQSVFSIEVARVADALQISGTAQASAVPGRTGNILVIEDDPDLRNLLQMLLEGRGYHVVLAADGPAALALATGGAAWPDLVLTALDLPGRMLLAPPPNGRAAPDLAPTVFVVDDDKGVRTAIRMMLEEQGWAVEDFGSGAAFLAALHPGRAGCLLVDAVMPGMDGFEVLQRLAEAGNPLPAIVVTGNGDVPTAVRAMKAGALDFLEKPVRASDLVAGVARALDRSHAAGMQFALHLAAAASIASLTRRQRDVMAMVLAGHPSKNIAGDLGISQRTVENHRAAIMRKTGAQSLPALARLAMAAASGNNAGTHLPRTGLPHHEPTCTEVTVLHDRRCGRSRPPRAVQVA